MTYILFDTNIILDIFLKRKPFYTDSYNSFLKLNNPNYFGFVSATTLTRNIADFNQSDLKVITPTEFIKVF